MDVKTNAVIKPHPAGSVDLTVPEDTEVVPDLEDLPDPIPEPPKVTRQNAVAGGTFDMPAPEPLLPMRMPSSMLYTPPPPLEQTKVKSECPFDAGACCLPPAAPTTDVDLSTLAWLLAGTFLVGAITGVLGMRTVSSNVASVQAAA
jgi:hypothetical protein